MNSVNALSGRPGTAIGRLASSQQPPFPRLADIDRIIQMAWEDRTSFDVIQRQFGLTSGQVVKLMRRELKPSSFRLWRNRTAGRATKHESKRNDNVDRFRAPGQRG